MTSSRDSDDGAATASRIAREQKVLNIPNSLTLSRLVLAVIFFVLLATREPWLKTCFVMFVVAASTDWLDGYLARKRGETTVLGRILDPFVDKVIVLGSFIFLLRFGVENTGLHHWMVTLIVARELLVTGLRSFLEGESVAFGADWAGKAKMFLQCFAIGSILVWLGVFRADWPSPWSESAMQFVNVTNHVLIWLSGAATAFSGVSYTIRATQLIRG